MLHPGCDRIIIQAGGIEEVLSKHRLMVGISIGSKHMKRIADIAVFSPDGSLKLIVEVKNYRKATDAWAAKLRGNLMADGFIPPSEFFLLILPEFSYLWRRSESPDAVPADYKFSTKDVLQLRGDAADPGESSSYGLELLTSSWLNALAVSQMSKEEVPELHWIFDSGLYDGIKDGSVKVESRL